MTYSKHRCLVWRDFGFQNKSNVQDLLRTGHAVNVVLKRNNQNSLPAHPSVRGVYVQSDLEVKQGQASARGKRQILVTFTSLIRTRPRKPPFLYSMLLFFRATALVSLCPFVFNNFKLHWPSHALDFDLLVRVCLTEKEAVTCLL